jgi:hypothetical protein
MQLGDTVEATVLWWDKRDGYGIAVDAAGNEYYISVDCCKALVGSSPLERQAIKGEIGLIEKGCVALVNVRDFLSAMPTDTSAAG